MFPECLLLSFENERDIISDKYVSNFKNLSNPARYVDEFQGLTDLLEYRDTAERILDKLHIEKDFPLPKNLMSFILHIEL